MYVQIHLCGGIINIVNKVYVYVKCWNSLAFYDVVNVMNNWAQINDLF